MSSQRIATSSDRWRMNWNLTMERYFIDLMLDQLHRGNRSGHTFNKQAWTDMLTMFNGKFGCNCDRDFLKTHYSFLWKQYNDLKNLLDQDGFSWDDNRKMVVADTRTWDAYLKAQPDAQIYRSKALPNFSDLCLVYAYTKADGRYSRCSHDLDFDDDVQGLITGASTSSIAALTIEHPKPEWTTSMDQYFVELMLVQIKKGNKRNSTFSKQAWKDMLTLFNAKFCFQYDEGFLKHRYKKLLKYYTDIRSLLWHNGFFWNDRTQIIVACDTVWDNYIKVYPDARSYRNRTLLNYQELGRIYESAANNGPENHVFHDKNIQDIILQGNNGEEKAGHFPVGNGILEVHWTHTMDRYLTDLLLDQALKGNQIGHTFVDEAWAEMGEMVNAKFGVCYDSDGLKRRFKYLRRQYNDIKNLLEHSGFYWDDTREMVTAEDYIWNSYNKKYPEARMYRNKSVPSYHKLCVIFGEENGDGRCSRSDNADPDSGGPDLMYGEESKSHAQSDYFREDWTGPRDRHLIDVMLQQVRQGNRSGSSFSDEAWIDMSLSFVDRFGLPYDRDLLRNRHRVFGELYKDLKNLLKRRGSTSDEKLQMVTAYDDEHPYAKSCRAKCNPSFNDLHLIYGDSTSYETGNEIAQSISSIDGGTRCRNGYLKKINWTPAMDRYFIDLMLHQVRQENMMDQRFNNQAWEDMAAKFIAQFGSQHGKDVLKSRYMILRKRFNDMKNLLDRTGFTWDEKRQMVVADRFLWNAHLKEHPDARSYRNRSLPNYNDLFLIYANPSTKEYENHSFFSKDSENFPLGTSITGKGYDKSPASSGPRRINWRATTESYFIDQSPSLGFETEVNGKDLDSAADAIFGDLQCPGSDFEMPNLRKRRKSVTSSLSSSQRKVQRPKREIREMSDEKPSRSYKEDGEENSLIEHVVDALQAITGMNDGLFLEACRLLEDERKAQKFVAMDVDRRSRWLWRKLRR